MEASFFHDLARSTLAWVKLHPHGAGFIVFLISLSESLAFIGLFVPGILMMTTIGAMMGSGVLPWKSTMTWAILGAIAGDGISYWLGHHFKEHLRERWPFKQMPRLMSRGEAFFLKLGGTSIIIGRFVGPVRPMIPVIAGMMGMLPRQFLFYNILSAIVWAPIYCLPGILVGISLDQLSEQVAKRAGLLAVGLLFLLWLFYVFVVYCCSAMKRYYVQGVNRIWMLWTRSGKCHRLRAALIDVHHQERHQLNLLALFALSAGTWCWWVTSPTPLTWLNLELRQLVGAIQHSLLHEWTFRVWVLLHPITILPLSMLMALWFLFKKRWPSLLSALTTVGWSGLVLQVSHWYGLKEPMTPDVQTLSMTAFTGLMLGMMRPTFKISWRFLSWALFLAVNLLLIGVQLYSRQTLFSAIGSGCLLGLMSTTVGLLSFFRLENHPLRLKEMLVPLLLGWSVLGSIAWYQWAPSVRNQVKFTPEIQTVRLEQWWHREENPDLLCRKGAVAIHQCVFNVQWLSDLGKIKTRLEKGGWSILGPFSWIDAMNALADEWDLKLQPTPEFHNDQLPALTAVKRVLHHPTHRLRLTLWNSGTYSKETRKAIWVGYVREEQPSKALGFLKYYRDVGNQMGIETLLQFTQQEHMEHQAAHFEADYPPEVLLIKD